MEIVPPREPWKFGCHSIDCGDRVTVSGRTTTGEGLDRCWARCGKRWNADTMGRLLEQKTGHALAKERMSLLTFVKVTASSLTTSSAMSVAMPSSNVARLVVLRCIAWDVERRSVPVVPSTNPYGRSEQHQRVPRSRRRRTDIGGLPALLDRPTS
jgi:hypothetical protein